jgi:hypothetical protein
MAQPIATWRTAQLHKRMRRLPSRGYARRDLRRWLVILAAATASFSVSCRGYVEDKPKAESAPCNGAALSFDPSNCGSCGHACASGEVCSQAKCRVNCGGGTTKCDALCVDTRYDPSNCGRCGHACASGELCSQGKCGRTCLGGATECDGVCVETQWDTAHCGTCGHACESGEVCSQGECGPTCQGGRKQCGTVCTDTRYDPANCGECEQACDAGEVCSQGECGLVCLGGTQRCDAACVDTQLDPAHCGDCGHPCPTGSSCVGGKCRLQCVGGTINCAGQCADPKNDPLNCGSCGNACDAGYVCSTGECVPAGTSSGTGGSCPARSFVMNAERAGQGTGACATTMCSLEPDGSLAMLYCIDPSKPYPWANCAFAAHQDLNPFDADNGGSGVLEVVFCTDGTALGQINLRYGEFPNEKSLTLLAPVTKTDDPLAMQSGCRTRYYAPEDACFGTIDFGSMTPEQQAQSLPESCSGLCGQTPTECWQDYGKSPLILTVEWPAQGAPVTEGELRLLSVRHYPSACQCDSDSECTASALDFCRKDTWSCDTGRAACQTGVCVSGGVRDCGDMVGRYREGSKPGVTAAFKAAFLRRYPSLGCPFDNGGTPYVHPVVDVEVQDYLQSDPSRSLSADGKSALVYNPDLGAAYLLYGSFWYAYMCLGQTSDPEKHAGGAELLGAPTGDKYLQPDGLRQDFEKGWLIQPREPGPTQVHLDPPMSLDSAVTEPCGENAVEIADQ